MVMFILSYFQYQERDERKEGGRKGEREREREKGKRREGGLFGNLKYKGISSISSSQCTVQFINL